MDKSKLNENFEVYRDERYVLGQSDGLPYLIVDGKMYKLSCHPYEPCTYIKGENCFVVIHNAFDPCVVLESFSQGKIVDSITGKLYKPKNFCQLLAFATEHFNDVDIGYLEKSYLSTNFNSPSISSSCSKY